MKRSAACLALAFFTSAVCAAPALPPAWPKQLGGTGTFAIVGEVPEGKWAAWDYTQKGKTLTYVVCSLKDYGVIHPDTRGMTTLQSAKAYFAANVTEDCATSPRMAPIYRNFQAVYAKRQT